MDILQKDTWIICKQTPNSYRKVASTYTSRLDENAGLFQIVYEGEIWCLFTVSFW